MKTALWIIGIVAYICLIVWIVHVWKNALYNNDEYC